MVSSLERAGDAVTREADVRAALGRMDEAQGALARLLRSAAPGALAARPPSGDWSPMENVRHLIFAEQHHFRTFLARGFRWSSAGAPPPNRTGERRLSPIGSDPETSLDEVLRVWAAVHEVVRQRCIAAPSEVAAALDGNLRHLNAHSARIERMLRG